MPIFYKEVQLECGYRADFICFGSVIVEIKAQTGLTEVNEAQVINYLRASRLERGFALELRHTEAANKRMDYPPQEYHH